MESVALILYKQEYEKPSQGYVGLPTVISWSAPVVGNRYTGPMSSLNPGTHTGITNVGDLTYEADPRDSDRLQRVDKVLPLV